MTRSSSSVKRRQLLCHRSISTQAQLYRVLLRQCRAWPSETVWLQPPIDPHTAGSARLWSCQKKDDDVPAVYQWFVQQQESSSDQWQAWYSDIIKHYLLQTRNEQNENDPEASNDSSSDSNSDDSDEEEEEFDRSLWTTRETLQQAIRTAFRHSSPQYAPLALTVFRQLRQQWYQQQSFTSIHIAHGLRISVLSQYIGRSLEHKYRFAYRVRIERLDKDTAVQLLGRTWHITEANDDERVVVDAPTTGAVGQLPVLEPHSCFEYVSGAELSSPQGQMSGWFHLASVPRGTPSAVVGMSVPALRSSDNKFAVEIKPFPLRVNDDHGVVR
ncbi:F-box protein 3 [Fistulifera solaris]|uniref:F-box protein 3 n=1 Tax=Fistulifera solaris TaxID=1519565 RepID=A0A1Z5KRV4_FISSO|nr:F-box protein 3 [Fistulifera solaris]|eukprot:GAX29019.1 F-box protein 3 [Fistulifera solaris]